MLRAHLHLFAVWFSFPVVSGPIVSLSAQFIRESEQVKVLALCTKQEDENHDGSRLTVFSLPARDLAGTTHGIDL